MANRRQAVRPHCDLVVDGSSDDGVFVPTGLRINGAEVLLPADAHIEISDLSATEPLVVTLTIFPTSLRIGGE